MERKVVLVNLVSDQTIPNFLSIKTFSEANFYVFITTEKMENPETGNRREWIIKAAGINEEVSKPVIVKPDVKENIIQQLTSLDWSQFDDIIVNITGGTKMMSLACYEFFNPKTNSIWYLPINSNKYHLCDDSEKHREIEYSSSVEEYLCCCGISKAEKRFTEKEILIGKDYTKAFFDMFISDYIDVEILEKIRKLFRADEAPYKNEIKSKKPYPLNSEDTIFIADFLKTINFPSMQENFLYKNEMEYLTGGWFEEYSYNLLREMSKNSESHLKLGVVLNPAGKNTAKYFTSNDLDVVMVNGNKLYVIECKSGGMDDNDLYNKTVYLASALRKYFGLTVKSVLFTLSEMILSKKEKAETLGIIAFDRLFFKDVQCANIIKEKLNL